MLYVIEANSVDDAIVQLNNQKHQNSKGKLNRIQAYLYGEILNNISADSIEYMVKNNHGTGKTTRKALENIIRAGEHPGEAINIVYEDGTTNGTGRAAKMFRDRIIELIEKLEFKFYIVDHSHSAIKFDV